MNLMEGLIVERDRVLELKRQYESLSDGTGMVGAMMMQKSLEDAKKAAASGDVVEMLRCYEELKGFTG